MHDVLDPVLLRSFLAVARTGSFTRAGDQLLRSQSAISLHVRKLEEQLGCQLLRRKTRRVVLTPAGQRLVPYGQRLMALHRETLSAFQDDELAGIVRLGTPEDFATAYLSAALARFAREHPGVQLDVTCDLTLNLLDLFRRGQLDIALLKREPAATIDGQEVWAEPLVWVAAQETDFTAPVTQLVVNPEPCVYRRRAFGSLLAVGREARAAYVCASLAGTLAAVRAGLGVTILPAPMAPDDLAVDNGEAMPKLLPTEIVLQTAAEAGVPARRLAQHLAQTLEEHGHREPDMMRETATRMAV